MPFHIPQVCLHIYSFLWYGLTKNAYVIVKWWCLVFWMCLQPYCAIFLISDENLQEIQTLWRLSPHDNIIKLLQILYYGADLFTLSSIDVTFTPVCLILVWVNGHEYMRWFWEEFIQKKKLIVQKNLSSVTLYELIKKWVFCEDRSWIFHLKNALLLIVI